MISSMEQTIFNYNYNQVEEAPLLDRATYAEANVKCCGQCDKDILDYEIYIQYDGFFYHPNCFKCHFCACSFHGDTQVTRSTTEATSLLTLSATPCRSAKNKLYCIQDFIHQSFECKICNQNFKIDSEIYPLEGDSLVHVDCVSCQTCKAKIDPNSEYSMQMNGMKCLVLCKKCTLDRVGSAKAVRIKTKRFEGNKHRLSSRQKEILKTKFSVNKLKCEEILGETLILERLAKDMDCSMKSVVQYVSKNKSKLEKQSVSGQKDNVIECMITELKKLDKTLPPNQSPFGVFTKRPTDLLSSLLSEKGGNDTTTVPNKCPFKYYPRSIESSPNSM